MIAEERSKKVAQLALKNLEKWCGCAQAAFCTIVDYLREEEGVELVAPETEEEMFKALVGLSGGAGNSGWGSCGALTGSGFAISLATGVGREQLVELRDAGARWLAFDNVAETIGQKFKDNFKGLTCHDVTFNRFGKWYDRWDPVVKAEFIKEEGERACFTPDKCTVAMAAAWAVEIILDLRKNPRTLEQVKRNHKL